MKNYTIVTEKKKTHVYGEMAFMHCVRENKNKLKRIEAVK